MLIINDATTYSGGTNVNAGTLQEVNYAVNFDTDIVASGATLNWNQANGNEVDIQGGTYTGGGTLLKTGSGTLGIGSGYYGTVTVALSAGALVDVEQGTLNANNTGQGSWTTNQSSLKVASGATFNAENAPVSVDAVTGAGTLEAGSWQNDTFPGTPDIVTVGVANGSGTFSGTVQDEGYDAPMALTKNGSGTQVFSGSCTYSGGTTVNGGTLSVTGMPGNLFVINSGGTLVLNVASYLYPAATSVSITGNGTLVKAGAGEVQLGQYQNPTDTIALGAGGLIDIEGGTFSSGDYSVTTNFSSNLASLKIASGATFEGVQSNVYVDALTGGGTYEGGYYGPRVLTIGVNNGSGTFSGTITGDPNYEGNASAVIAKTGTGVETLTGTINIFGAYNTTVLAVQGGSSASPSTLIVSPSAPSTVGNSGTLSSINIAQNEGDFAILTATGGTFISSTLNLGNQGDGTINAGGSSVFDTNNLSMALTGPNADAAPAFLNVSGSAQVNILNNGSLTLGQFYGRVATVNQTGGSVTFYSDGGSTLGGTGSIDIGGGAVEIYNLDGGLLSVPVIGYTAASGGAGGGTLDFNFSGGTLQTTAGSADFFPTGDVNLTIGSGGGTIDTHGNSVTINEGIAHAGIIIAGGGTDGGLTLNDSLGSGTLILAGASTYNGPTTVTAGTLDVTGSIADSGTITIGTASLIVAAPLALSPTSTITNNGTTNFSALSGINSVGAINGSGSLTAAGGSLTATHIRQSSLTIGSGSTVVIADSAGPGTTTSTSVLNSLSNSGTLDLKNNDLIINDPTQLSAVQAAIASAYNGGAWNGAGITSSSAAVHAGSYGLGYATNTELGTSTFDGQNISGGATVVKYTLLGDTKLRGTVGGGDYNTVLGNFDSSSADWSQGNFFNATTGNEVTGADYNVVLSNFDATATGAHSALKAAKVSAAVASVTPAGSSSDIVLNVNTLTGDISMQATTTMGLTLYNIVDASKTLIKTAALLISKTSTNWQVIKNTSSILAEGQNSTTYNASEPSSFDTIQLTAGQSIDLGDVFNVTSGVKDLTFEFSEPNINGGDPTTGTTYDGAAVNYLPVPEPTTLGLLGLGGLAMMRRRRKPSASGPGNA
jgi:autotransporter-associated beta strand protein